METHDVVILGSGPAGLTAAIYTARANLKPVVVEGMTAGGQLMNTTDVENYPGFPEGIQGPEMMDLFRKQAERFGTSFVTGDVTRVDFSARPFGVFTDDTELRSRAVIIATGASPRTLGIKGEQEYAGRGVSYCATCDGAFYRDVPVAVVGGGDTALEEALFLTRYASRIYLVHRRAEFRATRLLQERIAGEAKIEPVLDSVVEAIEGGDAVTGLRVRNVRSGETGALAAEGAFIFVGTTPNT